MQHTCTYRLLAEDLAPSAPVKYPEVRKELLLLMEEDQADRRQWETTGMADVKARKKVGSSDKVRTARLLELLTIIKSPGTANIGLDGSRAVWLLAQHSNEDVMALVLQKFRNLYYKDKSQVFYQGIPYLADRIRIMKGKKQLYGTQYFTDNAGKEGKFPISNPKALAKRRSRFGLCVEGECSSA